MNGLRPPLTAPPGFAVRQSRSDSKECCRPALLFREGEFPWQTRKPIKNISSAGTTPLARLLSAVPDSVRPCRNYVELHIILLYFPAFCDTILILINFTAENSRWNINIFAKVFPAKSPQIHPTRSKDRASVAGILSVQRTRIRVRRCRQWHLATSAYSPLQSDVHRHHERSSWTAVWGKRISRSAALWFRQPCSWTRKCRGLLLNHPCSWKDRQWSDDPFFMQDREGTSPGWRIRWGQKGADRKRLQVQPVSEVKKGMATISTHVRTAKAKITAL